MFRSICKRLIGSIVASYKRLLGYLYAAINLFVPRDCIVCSKELRLFEKHLCTSCWADIPLTYSWLYKHNPAEELFYGRVQTEFVLPLFIYRGNYRKCIHSLKYQGNKSLALTLGSLLGEKLTTAQVDYIIPVPLHWRKRLKRGYNQADIIAQGIVKSYHKRGCKPPKTVHNLITRVRFTPTQTKKERYERWKNVASAFRLNPKVFSRLEQYTPCPHFLIVDDVLTTGATIEACAMLLQERCCCRISVAILAYVP